MVDRIEPKHEEVGDFSLKRSKKRKAEQKDEQQKKKRKEDEQLKKKKTITTNMNEFSLKRSKKRKNEHKDEQKKKKRKEDKQQKTTMTANINDFSLKRMEEQKDEQPQKKRKEEQKDEWQKKKKKKTTANMNDFSLKKMKKKRTTNKKDFSLKPHVWTTNNKYLDNDLVVTHILTRLPAKSLMRFKSVCKSWKSIIEQDSHFINLHHTHSQARPPQLLTIVDNYRGRRGCFDLLSADLDCDGGVGDVRGATIRSRAITPRLPSPNVKVLGPVRGLLCFADLDKFYVMIYNVSTRQAVTPWIRSSVRLKKLPFKEPECEFGFDLDRGEHKVIFVWHDESRVPACCEVLTVGVDASWRIIDALPKRQFCDLYSTYANGSVYWFNRPFDSLLEFDMGSEKFRTILTPKFRCLYRLMELDGFLTIVPSPHQRTRMQTLWTFHDRNKKRSKGTTSNTSEGEEWSSFSFEQPCGIDPRRTEYHPIPGKDRIILETYKSCVLFRKNVKIARFFCYNKVDNTMSEFRIGGIPPLPESSRTCSALLVEGLYPASEKKPVKKRNKRCRRIFRNKLG